MYATRRSQFLFLIAASLIGASRSDADDIRPSANDFPVVQMDDRYRGFLEENLRWMLAREREARGTGNEGLRANRPRVGVFADTGVWPLGARSIVESLERNGVACQVLDRTQIIPSQLKAFETIVLPGGWAPYQLAALDAAAQSALRDFIQGGGRCVGICAGAYLVSRTARWEGVDYPYPLRLFGGVAEGPVAGLAAWPERGPAKLVLTQEGRDRGLADLEGRNVFYQGGSYFSGGEHVTTLARYPNGKSAVIRFSYGSGEVVLSGVHFERPVPGEGGDNDPPPKFAGAILKSLVSRP